jgi:HNH endonuclease
LVDLGGEWVVKKKGLSDISLRMLDLLKADSLGLTLPEIRLKLSLAQDAHIHLDRRLRDLDDFYLIERVGRGNSVRYVYRGERSEPRATGPNLRVRAEVLHRARGRCSMCGRTIEKHPITLVIDHKIPQEWGGSDEPDNLWAICEDCNAGKKNYFSSFDPGVMQRVMNYASPHMRIGELLKLFYEQPVEGWLIEFVAQDQDDWPKRTRDLRYLGWKIVAGKKKSAQTGRVESFYVLKSFEEWPDDPTKAIRDFETERAKRNRSR